MLCDEALPLVMARVRRTGWPIDIVDVDSAGLADRYGDRVPVVELDGVEVLSGRFDARAIRRALR